MQAFRAFDPLYGRMVLTSLEAELMRAPEVQRLRSIRMCNINSLLVTGASEISRFEHSLGVVRLAKEWAVAAEASEDDSILLTAAAILHDIKTGPFGHSLEYILSDSLELSDLDHQRVDGGSEEDFFQRTRANVSYMGAQFDAPAILGQRWSKVAQTIAGSGRLGPLISGALDLDNLDNVVRLAYHVGLASHEDALAALALARDMRIENGALSISSQSIPLVERWQFLRHQLYRYLLHDWAEFSAKGMLTKALELAADGQIIGTDSWILTDSGLINHLISMSVGENQEIGALIKRMMLAQLYHPVSLLKSSAVGGYRDLSEPSVKRAIELRISKILGCSCLFHVILDRSKTDRKVDLHIRDRSESVVIGEDSSEVLIGLFASRQASDRLVARATAELRLSIEAYVGDTQCLADPLEDPFAAVPNQLKLI